MDYYRTIRYALKARKIKIKKWVKSDGGGWANLTDKWVIMPWPKTIIDFGRCWHEIGHFEHKHNSTKTRYVEEYEAEIYAINKLKEYGLNTQRYTIGAKLYVMHQILKALDRKHPEEKIPEEIKKWFGKGYDLYKKKAKKTTFLLEPY